VTGRAGGEEATAALDMKLGVVVAPNYGRSCEAVSRKNSL
jgi:hypothetical protein